MEWMAEREAAARGRGRSWGGSIDSNARSGNDDVVLSNATPSINVGISFIVEVELRGEWSHDNGISIVHHPHSRSAAVPSSWKGPGRGQAAITGFRQWQQRTLVAEVLGALVCTVCT